MDSEKETTFLPPEERKDRPGSLFFLYCAANIGILGLVYGAIIVGFHLSFFQAILVTVLGSFSFGLVGLMSLAGRDTGTVTFVLSRAAFGFKGNLIPAIAALVSHAGWLSINVCTGTLTVLAVFCQADFPIFVVGIPHRHRGKIPTFSGPCQEAGSTTASCRMRACSIR